MCIFARVFFFFTFISRVRRAPCHAGHLACTSEPWSHHTRFLSLRPPILAFRKNLLGTECLIQGGLGGHVRLQSYGHGKEYRRLRVYFLRLPTLRLAWIISRAPQPSRGKKAGMYANVKSCPGATRIKHLYKYLLMITVICKL